MIVIEKDISGKTWGYKLFAPDDYEQEIAILAGDDFDSEEEVKQVLWEFAQAITHEKNPTLMVKVAGN